MSAVERFELATEACGHLVLKCSDRKVRDLRSPGAWACSVLRRYAQGALRKRGYHARRSRYDDTCVRDEPASESIDRVHHHLADALTLLEREVIAGSRHSFSASVQSQLRCFLEHRLGVARQTAGLSKRERGWLYQQRRRGKLAAFKACHNLRAKGSLDPELEAALRALLGKQSVEPPDPARS